MATESVVGTVLRCAAEATMCWNNIVVIGSKTYGDSYRIEANQMTWITRRKPEPNQDILTRVEKKRKEMDRIRCREENSFEIWIKFNGSVVSQRHTET